MAKTNDTIDGLLAEFRGYSSGMPPSYHVTMSWADFRKMLDRFDAAAKRTEWTHKKELETRDAVIQTEVAAREAEREAHRREHEALKKQVGDCAKLREALVSVQKKIHYLIGSLNVPNSLVAYRMEINGIINAALAEPVKNYEVGTAQEQAKRWEKFCSEHHKEWIGGKIPTGPCECPCYEGNSCNHFAWAQLPYESEATDGE